MRIALLDMFVLVAFSAVVAWYARQVDFDTGLISTAIPFSLLTVAFVGLTRKTLWVVYGCAVPVVFVCLPFFSQASAAYMIFLVMAALYRGDRPQFEVRGRIALAMGCAVLALIIGGLFGEMRGYR